MNNTVTAKQKDKTFGRIFPDFLSDVHLKIYNIIKCQWDSIMGKTPKLSFEVAMTYIRPTVWHWRVQSE